MLQKAKKNILLFFVVLAIFSILHLRKDEFSHVKSIIVDDINNVNNNNNNNDNNNLNKNDHDNE